MGLFDFLKSGKKKQPAPDPNILFLESLKDRISSMGHRVKFSTQYAAIVIDDELEIASALVPGEFHPSILPVIAITIHKEHFPQGIEASFMGLGTTVEDQVASACDNYIPNIFNTIIEALSDKRAPGLDFTSTIEGKEVLWHPHSSDNVFQGAWNTTPAETDLYSIVADEAKGLLPDKKLNWLKLYISRQPDGSISGECLLNNEVWTEGYYLLEHYAKTWKDEGEFLGQKQFIVYRRCNSHN